MAVREESWALADMPLNHIFVAFSFNIWEIINKRQHIYNLHNISRCLAGPAHTQKILSLTSHLGAQCTASCSFPKSAIFHLISFPTRERERWTRRQPEVARMRQIKLGGFYAEMSREDECEDRVAVVLCKNKYKFNFHTCEPSWPMLEAQRRWCEGDPDVA